MTSDPAGAYVKVDGVLTSITPYRALLPPGQHRIDVSYGPASRTQTVNVTRGGETVIHIELKTPAANVTGGLQISTEPLPRTVSIDGVNRGTSPVTVQDLAPGPHNAVLVKTARGWKYEPARRNGQPARTRHRVEIALKPR